MPGKNEARRQAEYIQLLAENAQQAIFLNDLTERVIDQMCGICITVDPSGTIHDANKVFCNMVGMPRVRIIGTHFKKYIHPDDLEETLAVFSEIENTGLPEPFFNRYRKGDGWQLIAWSSTPALWMEKRISVGWIVSGKDDPLIHRISNCNI